MAKPTIVKVCLTNEGVDTETPWAEDLGPASPTGSRRVRLVNVPFMHAKPTWGDTIVVTPRDGRLTWDRGGVPWSEIDARIVEDGGRWAMIVDYVPHPDTRSADDAFDALTRACAEVEVVCEGAWAPRGDAPGRAYLAVKNELTDLVLMHHLRNAALPCELIQIHPPPAMPKAKPAAKRTKSKPVARKPAAKTARAKKR